MKSLKNNKGVIAAIIIFVFGMFIYNMLFKSDELLVGDTEKVAVGSDLVEIYSNLEKVTLDTLLFSSPGYKKLTDFSVEVPLQPVGRSNPFDVIGR